MMRTTRVELVLLLAILLLAGWLRFGWLGVNSFAGDEARISLDALRLTRAGEFVFIAQQSSTGIPFLPASVWMFAPPYFLTPDPLGATLYVSLLSWLTVVGVWAMARQWGMWSGLCAALFLAASPYAVFYGRSIWQPNLLPFLGLAWAWTGWWVLARKDDTTRMGWTGVGLTPPTGTSSPLRAWSRQTPTGSMLNAASHPALRTPHYTLIAHIFLSGFIVQVHFAGAALALGTAILFVYGRWWRHWRAVLLGGGLALLCTVPYLWYLTTQAPQVLAQLRQIGGGTAAVDLSGARNLLHMALGYDWGYLALGEYDTYSRGLTTVIPAGVLVVAGAIALGWSVWRMVGSAKKQIDEFVGKRRASSDIANAGLARQTPTFARRADEASPAGTSSPLRARSRLIPTPSSPHHLTSPSVLSPPHSVLIIVWLLASPFFFLRHTTPVLPHYQLVALPALALLVGLATTLLDRRVWRWGVSMAVGALALAWTVQIATSLDRAAVERPPQSALSSILRESRDAAFAVSRDRPAVFYTHGDDPAISGEVAVFRVLLWDHPDARIVDGATTLILSGEASAQMSTLAPIQAWEELVDLGLVGDVREFPRRPPGEAFVMTMVDADGGRVEGVWDAWGTRDDTWVVPYNNGVLLEGIRARRVGERLRISSLWAAGALTGAPAQAFHHLYRIGDVDDPLPAVRDLTPADQLSTPDYGSDVSMGMRHWREGDQVIVMADFMDVPPGVYRLVIGQYTLPDGERVPLVDGGDSVSWAFRWE